MFILKKFDSLQQPVIAVPLVMPVSRRKEDEVSVGSAPLAKQQSYQASEYASSPVKTKTVTGMCQNSKGSVISPSLLAKE